MNYAILIGLRVDRRDDALAEAIIERIVDGRRRDAESRRRRAVDCKPYRQAVLLQVARDIGERRRLPQPLHELRRPELEFGVVGIFKHELILRAGDAGVDRQILHRLHVQRGPGDVGGFLPEPANDLARGKIALIEGLQNDEKRPAFGVWLVPSTPMKELRRSTSGSLEAASSSSPCSQVISENDALCGPSKSPE